MSSLTAPLIDRPASPSVSVIVRLATTTSSASKLLAEASRSIAVVQSSATLLVGVDSEESLERKSSRVASMTMPSGRPTMPAPVTPARMAV